MDKKIKINTHSSIRINDGGKVFYFDPFNLEGRYSDADYIFVTHDHYDHLDPKSISNVRKSDTKFICPKSIIKTFLSDCGIKDRSSVIEVNPGDKVDIEANIAIKVVPAYNIDKKFHKKEYNWVGYILNVGGFRYYVAGDTDVTEEAKVVSCDVALVPIGGTYTMTCEEAAELINKIRPKIAIPTHYGSIVGEEELGKKFLSLIDTEIEAKELIDFDSFRKVKVRYD